MAQFLQPQQRLAGYEVLELVGKGGMGEVYRARQLSMDRIVALKVLNQRQAKQDPTFAKNFVEEARAAGRLGHPNIISVHDVGSTRLPGSPEEVYYFSMELIEGETIKDVIKREGRCDEKLISRVMYGMGEALAYAEKHGIVHRDIKPDNIMVSTDGRVKLADLGLALQVGGEGVAGEVPIEPGSGGTTTAATPVGSKVMGTPMYMSPEQARALKLDHRSDQYSLGATLYHMLTGKPPYEGTDGKAVMRAHVFDPVPDPRNVVPDVSEAWRQLCMKLMAKTPEGRFATAEDLRVAIQAAMRGLALASLSKRTVRILQRREGGNGPWVWVGVGAAVLIVGAVVAVGAGRGGRGGGDTPSGPAPSEQTAGIDEKTMHAALAGLPGDPTKALAEIDHLRQVPEWQTPRAQQLLNEETARRKAAQEAAKRDLYKSDIAAIDQKIKAGDLQGARDAFSALAQHPDAPPLQSFKDLNTRLDAACSALAGTYRQRIAKAGATGDVDAALTEARNAPISAEDLVGIENAAKKRRSDLVSTAAELARAAERRAWEALAAELDGKCRAFAYNDIEALVVQRAASFSGDTQKIVATLSDLGSMTLNAETALRKDLERRRPWLETRLGERTVKVQVTKFATSESPEITYVLSDAPGDYKKADLLHAPLPWRDLLDQALPKDDNAARTKAAALWAWRSPDARAAIEALGDDPIGRGLRELERGLAGGLSVNGQVEREGERIHITYDLAARPQALLADLTGDGLKAGERDLFWTTSALVAKGSRAESSLPRVTLRYGLLPPCTIRAAFRLHEKTCLGLAGVEAGGRRVRIGFSHHYYESYWPLEERVGTLVTAPDGVSFTEIQLAKGDNLWNADEPLEMEWSVGEDGRIGATVNKQPIGAQVIGAVPQGQPVTFVMQAYQFEGQTTLELCGLDLIGKPPR